MPRTFATLSRSHTMLLNPLSWRVRSRSERFAASRAPRLRLESLEDRATPATFAVTMLADIVNATDGRMSLREVITVANAHPGADTIVLPAGKLKIKLTGAGENSNATGDFDITD